MTGRIGKNTSKRFRVCIVDMPGRGRSQTAPEFASLSLQEGADAIRELIAITGPAILVGHSMGSQTIQRVVNSASESERAKIAGIVLLAPTGPPELIPDGFPGFPEDEPVDLGRDSEIFFFALSDQFPAQALDNYLLSLHPESAKSWNEILVPGVAPNFGADLFDGIPTVIVAAEGDNSIAPDRAVAAGEFWNVPVILLEADWGFRGNGHLFMIERNSDRIAQRLMKLASQLGMTTLKSR